MAADLRRFGCLDESEYPTIFDCLRSLKQLYFATDICFVLDLRVLNLLVKGWINETPDDFDVLTKRVHDQLTFRLAEVAASSSVPARLSKYGRDLDVSIEL